MYAFLWDVGRLLERAGQVWFYLAAGTLTLGELRRAIARSWEEFGPDDVLSSSGLMSWERSLYERFLKPDDRILVVGAGTGRDLIALLKLGYHAEGLDVAPRAIGFASRLAEHEGLSAKLSVGAIETVELSTAFDAFIFSWCCYSVIPQRETRIEVLGKVKARLNPAGRILISYIYAERLLRPLAIRLTRCACRMTRSDWRPELGDVFRASRDRRAIHYEHRFSAQEFEDEARAAGLVVGFHGREDVGTAVLMPRA